MIIWGSKSKIKQVGGGSFFCPNCRSETSYLRQRVARYFTLYFIPLFETRTLGEYVSCGQCCAELPVAVLELSRAQIEKALEPWVCAECGNRNPAGEGQCLACGVRRRAEPPPLPGRSASSPPPLPAKSIPMPTKKMSAWGRVGVTAAGLFGAFMLFRIVQLLIHFNDSNHRTSYGEPGEMQLDQASRSILSTRLAVVHGNNAVAARMAEQLSEELKTFEGLAITGGGHDSSLMTKGQFLVFCQLNEDSCAFLVHVPQMKRYTRDAAKTMAEAVYVNACRLLDEANQPKVRRLAIATRGDLLYDTVLIGDYAPGTKNVLSGVEKIVTDGFKVPSLPPFFAPVNEPSSTGPQ